MLRWEILFVIIVHLLQLDRRFLACTRTRDSSCVRGEMMEVTCGLFQNLHILSLGHSGKLYFELLINFMANLEFSLSANIFYRTRHSSKLYIYLIAAEIKFIS